MQLASGKKLITLTNNELYEYIINLSNDEYIEAVVAASVEEVQFIAQSLSSDQVKKIAEKPWSVMEQLALFSMLDDQKQKILESMSPDESPVYEGDPNLINKGFDERLNYVIGNKIHQIDYRLVAEGYGYDGKPYMRSKFKFKYENNGPKKTAFIVGPEWIEWFLMQLDKNNIALTPDTRKAVEENIIKEKETAAQRWIDNMSEEALSETKQTIDSILNKQPEKEKILLSDTRVSFFLKKVGYQCKSTPSQKHDMSETDETTSNTSSSFLGNGSAS